jgi:hypothetical protein
MNQQQNIILEKKGWVLNIENNANQSQGFSSEFLLNCILLWNTSPNFSIMFRNNNAWNENPYMNGSNYIINFSHKYNVEPKSKKVMNE